MDTFLAALFGGLTIGAIIGTLAGPPMGIAAFIVGAIGCGHWSQEHQRNQLR